MSLQKQREEKIQLFLEMVKESDNIVFFGGAGVSTESGIPDFRSVDGLYNQEYDYPPETILSHTFYRRNTEEFYRFYRNKMLCLTAQPNMAHRRLAELEKSGVTDLDEISRPFGELMSELFVYEEDAFMHILRRFGFFIGKYIYLLDAFLDLEKDKEKGSYNPFKETCQQSGFEERMTHILDSTARQAVIEFEKLPLDRDLPILRNILYEGVKVRLLKYLQEERRSDK